MKLNTKVSKLQEKIKIKSKLTKQIDLLEYTVEKHVEKIQFFSDNDTCKTCSQTIGPEFKAEVIKDHESYKAEKELIIRSLVTN